MAKLCKQLQASNQSLMTLLRVQVALYKNFHFMKWAHSTWRKNDPIRIMTHAIENDINMLLKPIICGQKSILSIKNLDFCEYLH